MEFSFSPADPETIYLQMNARHPALIDLHSLNIHTGDLATLAENPGRFIRWLVTPGGPPHAIVVNSENDYELARYEDGQFVAIATFDRYDNPLGPLPCVSTPDGKALWIGSNRGTDLTRLGRVDLRFDRLGAETDETEIAALVDAYILHLGDWMKEFNAVVRQFAERETTLTIWAHAVEATTPQQGRVLTEIGQRLVPINGRTK
ncbi:hypothetical protein [Neorhizobium tomejilense]|uniref:hypothetical protein n=1 Tax=Neorhizobium tomejilense TaxID=2093828 RepID=UPI003ECCB3CF